MVVASYKPGDAEKFGLDAVTLREQNSRLVYAQVTGYQVASVSQCPSRVACVDIS